MNMVTTLVLLGWIPVAIALFAVLPGRRAVLVAAVTAWLFLPMTELVLPGMPNFGKATATALGVSIGVVLFDWGRVAAFRPKLIDLAAVGVFLAPMAASVTNGLGPYDGAAAMMVPLELWTVPYFLGRLYFSDMEGLRDLVVAIFIGGLVYVPLCLYEIRMSPQLHTMFYGFHQHSFGQTKRFGGWRPTVFMQHGLGVGMWMTAASLMGVWLWRTGSLRQIRGVPMTYLLPVLLLTTLLCKSFGALMLLVIGVGALVATKWMRTSIVVMMLLVVPLGYMGLRTAGLWTGESLVEVSRSLAGDARAGSLDFRLRNEDVLIERALDRPVFGWGGWGRNRPDNLDRKVVTDGLWVISLGKTGVVGLVALLALMLGPAAAFIFRAPFWMWYHPATVGAAAMAVLSVLFMIDCLFNAVANPVFVLGMGGLAGLRLVPAAERSRIGGVPIGVPGHVASQQRGAGATG